MTDSANLRDKALALAAGFDRSFALPRSAAVPPRQDFIAIRIRDDAHAIRLPQLSELRGRVPVTRLPGSGAELLGVANVRGMIVPVYDLGHLLGYSPASVGVPGWCVLVASAPVALAFEVFDGHLRLSDDASAQAERAKNSRPHINEVLRTSGQILPIIDLPSVINGIARTIDG